VLLVLPGHRAFKVIKEHKVIKDQVGHRDQQEVKEIQD
jgi:hypothetical protein